MPAQRWGPRSPWTARGAGAVALALAAAACDLAYSVPARHLECGGEPARARCEAVARASLSAMNLEAIGPIDTISVDKLDDCVAWGRANGMSLELGTAAHCWAVDVIGDKSRGRTTVYQPVEGGPLKIVDR